MQQASDIWEIAFQADTKQGKEHQICRMVLDELQQNRVFLDPSLSLAKFCTLVGTNTTYLSSAVNVCLGCNLKQLVNWYRIRHAKQLMESYPATRMKDIPAACGFASKSAFYDSFRRLEGTTPVEYLAKRKV